MSHDRWQRTDDLFARALELPPEKRAAFLDAECDGDEKLRARVERLLALSEHDSSVLEPGGALLDSPFDAGATQEDLATRDRTNDGEGMVENFRLVRKLGEGGMGDVYEAMQEKPVRRRVALKVIKLGMHTKEVLARFEAERQALGMMEHPNIARVFDAGATRDGRPFFVMELVSGVPITDYCNENRLTTRERLELFLPVCAGVQHAHRKAIIHRDLKPSNILVTKHDDQAVPKIIDFGVAKAAAQPLTEETLYTAMGQVIGTPAYMSPEQAVPTGFDIDTRADVYSLGVVLYEILVGARPIDVSTKEGFEEVIRSIREVEPSRPSTRIGRVAAETPDVVMQRRAPARRIASELRGDLDWITMKALEKDPARRYGSVSELADDIRRHLSYEPVEAGPPSATYLFRKFARRHRVALAVAGAIGFGVLAAGAGLTYALIESNRQRAEAQEARDEAQGVTNFLIEMLASASTERLGPDVTVHEVLDQAAVSVSDLVEHPRVEAAVREVISSTYRSLGAFDEAEEHARRSVALHEEKLGRDDPQTLSSLVSLAAVLTSRGRYDESEALLTEARDKLSVALGPDDPIGLQVLGDLARVYQLTGRYDESQVLFEEAVTKLRDVLGPEDHATLRTANNLAILYLNRSDYEAAEPLLLELVDLHRRVRGPAHPTTLSVMNNLASLYRYTGRLELAEPIQRETLETQRRTLGNENHNTVASVNNLALVYLELGRYAEAEPLFIEAMEHQRRTVGRSHPRTIISMGNLGDLYTEWGRLEEGEPLLREAIDLAQRVLPAGHAITGATLRKLGVNLEGQGRYEEAEEKLLAAVASHELGLGLDHQRTQKAISSVVEFYGARGRAAEAAEWRTRLTE